MKNSSRKFNGISFVPCVYCLQLRRSKLLNLIIFISQSQQHSNSKTLHQISTQILTMKTMKTHEVTSMIIFEMPNEGPGSDHPPTSVQRAQVS